MMEAKRVDHAQSALRTFVHRLMIRSPLTRTEQAVILDLPGRRRVVPAGRDLNRPGEALDAAALVMDGLAARYDQMREGTRQFTAFYIPGDMCDLHSTVLPVASWGIQAIANLTIFHIPHAAILRAATDYPGLALAFWRDSAADGGMLAKWASNVGGKSARARLAHLICELGLRLELAGLGSRTRFSFPATQAHLAEAVGLTAIHVNRVLQKMKRDELVEIRSRTVNVLDWPRLVREGDFDPTYLQVRITD